MNFIPISDEERREMLKRIGVASVEELLAEVKPKAGELNLPEPMSELELISHMRFLSSKNSPMKNFIGAGAYDHFIPSAVKHILSRAEFYTAYTPYQAEISQGILQAMYEFQTYVCMLTGCDIANASMYDGASSLAESAFLASSATGKSEIAVLDDLHPHYKQTLATYCNAKGLKITDGINENTACAIIQNPDFYGNAYDIRAYAEEAHGKDALLIACVVESTSLALIEPPAKLGADIVVGECQPLGIPLSYGGPYAGFFAVKKEYMKNIPGRLSGMTVDTEGKRGFILTLQAREQHIRRERASSNICSNEQLCALACTVYLSLLGSKGLRAVAKSSYARAHELAEKLEGLGFTIENKRPFYNEFVAKSPVPVRRLQSELAKNKILAGFRLDSERLLLCCTEKTTHEDIDEFIKIVGGLI